MTDAVCKMPNCSKPSVRLGLCEPHWRWANGIAMNPMSNEPIEAVALKPCPFCDEVPDHRSSDGITRCTNPDCAVEVAAFSVEDWNTRTLPVTGSDAELIERLRSLCLAGEGSPDDLGGDTVTLTLRNPDGFEIWAGIQALTGGQTKEPDGFTKMHFENCDYFKSRGSKPCNLGCCS